VPGDLLLHPVALTAILLVLVNDFILKPHFPGHLSGKLSDVAGPVFFPLLLITIAEFVRWFARMPNWALGVPSVVAAVVVVGTAFALTKVWPPAAEGYRVWVGVAIWPSQVASAVVRGTDIPEVQQAPIVEDPTDLIGLIFMPLAVWVAWRVSTPNQRRGFASRDQPGPR
jgi:hypothetical protein